MQAGISIVALSAAALIALVFYNVLPSLVRLCNHLCLNVRLIFVKRVKLRNIDSKFVVKLRKLLFFYFVYGNGNSSVFTRKIFGMILLGKVTLISFVVNLHADNLLFKAGNKRMASELKLLIFSRASVRLNSVNGTGIVDNNHIAYGSFSVNIYK